jgi:hypothetical protein
MCFWAAFSYHDQSQGFRQLRVRPREGFWANNLATHGSSRLTRTSQRLPRSSLAMESSVQISSGDEASPVYWLEKEFRSAAGAPTGRSKDSDLSSEPDLVGWPNAP